MDDILIQRLDTATSGLAATRARVEARVPWSLAAVFDESDEARWGPPEVLAHVEEMASFWLGEMERIIDGDGRRPVPFGRTASDRLRIGLIERDRVLPPRELYDRIAATYERVARRIPTLTATDLAKIGTHVRWGDMDVPAIIDRFLVTHLEEHVRQLESILGDGSGP